MNGAASKMTLQECLEFDRIFEKFLREGKVRTLPNPLDKQSKEDDIIECSIVKQFTIGKYTITITRGNKC